MRPEILLQEIQALAVEDVQLSARRFLAVKTLDEILKDRNEISASVRTDVREIAAYGVEISRADVKDLVFHPRKSA